MPETLKIDYPMPVGLFSKVILDEEKSLRLVLTENCNLSCEFCVYKVKDFHSPEIKSNRFAEMKPTKGLKELLVEMRSNLHYNIAHLTGGEPTLSKEIVPIARLCKSAGYSVNVVSNLIDEKPIMDLLKEGLLGELTFSYVPMDSKQRKPEPLLAGGPNERRNKQVKENVSKIRSLFPDLVIKANIIMAPHTNIDHTVEFVNWCWNNGVVPRMQRDRSSDRIAGSTESTNAILKRLGMKPKQVTLRIPGATEICQFENSDKKTIYVKVFNKNFRLREICKFCDKREVCSKALSSIRVYDTVDGPRMCFCTQLNDGFANLGIKDFLKSDAFKEIKGYRENKASYFERFCTTHNFQ